MLDAVGEPLRTLQTTDGRTLAFAVWGDPNGFPIMGLHGTPGCRLQRWPHEELYPESACASSRTTVPATAGRLAAAVAPPPMRWTT